MARGDGGSPGTTPAAIAYDRCTAGNNDPPGIGAATERQPEREDNLFAEYVETLPAIARWPLALVLILGSIVCLVGSRLLAIDAGWPDWIIATFILEPVGVLSVLAAFVLFWPRSNLSLFLGRALARRKYGSAILVILCLGAILEGGRWCARVLMK
jgi:hypothetical protein